jgi:glycerol-3-phosphate dehydrogenase
MLEGVRALFPSMGLSLDQCISSLAGIRPVISSGNAKNPSEESREHDIWVDDGMVTVAGGKLTTYRRVALDAIKAAIPFLPPIDEGQLDKPQPGITDTLPPEKFSDTQTWQRLHGRYGQGANTIITQTATKNLQPIDTTPTLWAELPYVAEHESVRHLTDLMLRRVRLGLLLPNGGKTHMKRIKKLCRTKLGWSRSHWRQEEKAYFSQWEKVHDFIWRVKPKGKWQRLLESISDLFEKIFNK